MADPVRLGQCFLNLFTNAAKYTKLGGRIEVSVARDDEGAVERVRAMALAFQATLCRTSSTCSGRLLVVQPAREWPRPGADNCAALIELHEGRVEAKSDGAGMASEYVSRLPVMDAVQDIHPAPPSDGRRVLGGHQSRRACNPRLWHASVAANRRGRWDRYEAFGSRTVNVVPSSVDELT
jgi:hypothetical protein